MTNFRLVAEVHRPIDVYGSDFLTSKEVIWRGDHRPMASEASPESLNVLAPAEHGTIRLQQQRLLHLGWKTVDAVVQAS